MLRYNSIFGTEFFLDGVYVEIDRHGQELAKADRKALHGHASVTSGLRALWSSQPVHLKRAVGLMFDLTCLYVLWFVPAIVHGISDPRFWDDQIRHKMLTSFSGAAFLLQAVGTPFPLITLRFFCKVVMRIQTPGEMLSGYSSVSKQTGWRSILNNTCFAFWQYLMYLFSHLFAFFVPGLIASMVAVIPNVQHSPWPVLALAFIGVIVAYFSTLIWLLSRWYKPSSSSGLEAGVDRLSNMLVVARSAGAVEMGGSAGAVEVGGCTGAAEVSHIASSSQVAHSAGASQVDPENAQDVPKELDPAQSVDIGEGATLKLKSELQSEVSPAED